MAATPQQPTLYVPQTLSNLLVGPTDIDWIVEGLIPPQTSGLFVGEGGVGKTWLSLELALAIATGTPWLGKFPTRQGTVLIVDEENAELMLRIRMTKLLKGRGLKTDDLPLYFLIGEGINLSPKRGSGSPSESFKQLLATVDVLKPILTLFDSLTRVHTSNENAANEMAEVFRQMRTIINTTGTSITSNHHTRKMSATKSGDRIRGSSDLRNFADYTMLMDKTKKGPLKVQHDKSRWSEILPPFSVKLEVTDEWAKLTHTGKASSDLWDWLEEFLEDAGKATRVEILDGAEEAGFSRQGMDSNLKEWQEGKKLMGQHTKGKPKFYWLPDALDQAMI